MTECNIDASEKIFLESLLRKFSNDSPLVLFDVGAFRGDYTEYVRQRASSRMRAHLFEPSPDSFSRCQARFAGNESIFCNNLGVDRDYAEKIFYCLAGDKGSGSSMHFRQQVFADKPFSTLAVPTTSIDRYLDEHKLARVDLMKIDTEGNEFQVLLGAEGALRQQRISVVQFEYGGTWADAGTSLPVVDRYLESVGYRLLSFHAPSASFVAQHIDTDDFHYENYYALPQSSLSQC